MEKTPPSESDTPGSNLGCPDPAAKEEEELHPPGRLNAERLSAELPTTADDVAARAIEAEERDPDATKEEVVDTTASSSDDQPAAHLEPIYSVIPRKQKVVIILVVAAAGLFSPLTGAIYLPALNSIASDLKVNTSLTNLSITTYQIFQGLAPSFIGSLSDVKGRRPAYIATFSIYLVANLALALQNSYPALMVLRCLQSAGSSATIALSAATVADLCTRAERGTWLGYTTLGISLGPALGPVIGGLLNEYLGWHSIFWFLMIFSGIVTIIMVIMLPETGRSVVGNGSVPPKKWNRSIMQGLRARRGKPLNGGNFYTQDKSTIQMPKKRPSPLSSLLILLEPEGGITLGFGALFFSGYFMVSTTLSEQLTTRFGFSSAVTGLCYLPLGFGSLISRWSAGKLFDYNFRRHARLLGQPLDLSRQQGIETFPIERIRLEVCLPMVYISCGTVLAYAWTMETKSSLAGIEVVLFFMGLFFSGVQQGLNTLIVDTHADTPATAIAANNLFRCFLSAGGTAVAPLMIEKMGLGFMGVFISGVWLFFSPCLWLVMLRGKKWREDEKARQDKKEAEKRQSEGETA
ncbi:Quinidine resistance protein 2 [Cytospora mali]|uniref:Quinidine resistance protein 2 n=1 Tax=Cytospora mali TaxID=578113 RepID=A0A194V6X9_CYTMA|nr:Quinidine resistance protein 2 [Valsa mali var. pyri (nom. inval.)]